MSHKPDLECSRVGRITDDKYIGSDLCIIRMRMPMSLQTELEAIRHLPDTDGFVYNHQAAELILVVVTEALRDVVCQRFTCETGTMASKQIA